MALHVPKAPGFAQMLKEGAKVGAALGRDRSLRGGVGWEEGAGSLSVGARGRFWKAGRPRCSMRTAGWGPGWLCAPRPPQLGIFRRPLWGGDWPRSVPGRAVGGERAAPGARGLREGSAAAASFPFSAPGGAASTSRRPGPPQSFPSSAPGSCVRKACVWRARIGGGQ